MSIVQTYESIAGYPVQEFIEWYEKKYNTYIGGDLVNEFSYDELSYLSEEFQNEKEN